MEIPEDFKNQVKEQVTHLSVESLEEALSLLLTIPFPDPLSINNYIKICKEASPSVSMLDINQLNNKANIVGNADPETSLRTESHVHFRQKQLYTLHSYIGLIFQSNIDLKIETILNSLKTNKPEFIEDTSIEIWARGITAGFNKDFISASHILMPQFEHALHNIVEIKNGVITTLEAKRQLEPTLAKILSMLKTIIDTETHFSIESFLQNGIDINFRNNLLHGLLPASEINRYGIYLWWLSIKIYFGKDFLISNQQN